MDCRAFRQLHGDWVDDVLGPQEQDFLDRHVVECSSCARFDTLARRALMVARNAPQLEVSSDFSARLAARIAEERRNRIAEHGPSHVERTGVLSASRMVRFRTAAAVVMVVGGAFAVRAATVSSAQAVGANGDATDSARFATEDFDPSTSALTAVSSGRFVVVSPMRPIGGALMPLSDDPLLDGGHKAGMGDASATSVAATAPLWPTAQMAAHAANRFAAMEFGDVRPVAVVQTSH
jgi:hypothetical protein